LSALRRRGDWLEIRVVNEGPAACRATLEMALAEARTADLLGRPGAPLAVSRERLELDLGPWEIRTIQARLLSHGGSRDGGEAQALSRA
jgi:alpha-mannosidase